MHNFARLLAAFWISGSLLLSGGAAFAQTAAPTPVTSTSDRLLRDVGREIAAVEPVLERYGFLKP